MIKVSLCRVYFPWIVLHVCIHPDTLAMHAKQAFDVLLSVAPCRILASCTDLMQAIKVLVLSSKDLQRDIVESGRVSELFFVENLLL